MKEAEALGLQSAAGSAVSAHKNTVQMEGGVLTPPQTEHIKTAHKFDALDLKPGSTCPHCGGILILRHSERGEFLGCSNYPDCAFIRHLPAAPSTTLAVLSSLCPQCGRALAVRQGRYGIYIGCSAYPQCRFIVEEEKESPLACPLCGKGHLVKRHSRRGHSFYACTNYPACDFLLPGEPVQSKCPDCGFPLRYKKKIKAGIALYCPNPLCSSRHKRRREMWHEDTGARAGCGNSSAASVVQQTNTGIKLNAD